MMRHNLRKMLASFGMLLCTCAFAQMSGTYTIGGSGADFATINAAYSALKAQHGKGTLVFQINPGTYNETVRFLDSDFPDGVVSFILKGTNATIVSSDDIATIINEFHAITIQGITVKNTGIGAAFCLRAASFCEIKDCRFESTGNAAFSIIKDSDCNIIQNNIIKGGDYGVFAMAPTVYFYDNHISDFRKAGFATFYDEESIDHYGHEILRNIFDGTRSSNSSSLYCAILLKDGPDNIIKNNDITLRASTSENVYGIYIEAESYNDEIKNNYITTKGTALKYVGGYNCNIENNFIFSSAGKGIDLNGSVINLVNNEVTSYADDCINVIGNVTAINNSTFLYNSLIGSAFRATTGSKIVNNSFFNSSTSSSTCAIQLDKIGTCDYNNLYSLSSQLGIYNNVGRASLSAWRSATGKDIHSISADPLYSDPELGSTRINLSSPLVNKANASEMPAYDKTGEPREYNAIGAWDPYPSSSWPGGAVSRRASDLRKALRESRMLQNELNERNVLDSNALAAEYSINYSAGLLNVVSSAQEDATYALIVADMLTGEVRIQTSVVLVGGISQSIDLSVLPQGYYVVRLVTATGTNSWKITR